MDRATTSPRARLGRLRRFFGADRGHRRGDDAGRNAFRNWLDEVFMGSPLPLALCDVDHAVVRANLAMASLLGYPDAASMAGRSLDDHIVVVGSADRRTGATSVDRDYRRRDGTTGRARVTRTTLERAHAAALVLVQVQDISARSVVRADLEAAADRDPLTGLWNRQGLLEAIGLELGDRGPSVCCLVLVSIDRLNSIHHVLGEPHGDQVVGAIAERLRMATRVDDVRCRLGGDQFAVLLRRPVTPADALTTAERLISLSKEHIDVFGQRLIASVSIGISRSRPDSTVESLLREADMALSEAQSGGADRYEIFDGALKDAVEGRSRLEGELRLALSQERLTLHFQPEIDLLNGNVVAVEALARWPHPDRGLLSADEFVPVAEQTGMVADLGDWVLRSACEHLAAWSAEHPCLSMRVNVSAVQLAREDLVDDVRLTLAATGVPAERLCLELTETAVMVDAARSVELLAALARLGVRIAIDDFGTGFSSLGLLHELPAHVVKIDRSFVSRLDGATTAAGGEALIRAIIGLAAALDLEVVAEGVETQSQRDLLLSLGCRRAQGHLFSPARSEAELLEWLAGRTVRSPD